MLDRIGIIWGEWGNLTWVRYTLAVIVTTLATLLRWGLPGALEGTPYLAFYPAVVAAAALGGFGPGLLATVGSMLCVDLLFDPTLGWMDVGDPVVMGRLAIFLAGGVGTSLLSGDAANGTGAHAPTGMRTGRVGGGVGPGQRASAQPG